MDLDVMADVQDNIIGNCLCLLGDSMAMPVGSMIKHFRPEFEAHIEEAAVGSRQFGSRGDSVSDEAGLRCPRLARPPDVAGRLDHVLDRRARGARAGGRVAARRGEARRRRDPVLLLRAEARRARRRMPHVHGRGRGDAEAADLVLHAGQGRDGGLHPDRPREARAERGGRVPARQPPARLPGVRQGRRVPAAGHLLRLGPGPQPLRRGQAELPQADRALAADRDRPRALHPLLPLRALLAGGRRGRPARVPRARRPHLRRHLRRASLRGAVLGQRDRAVPGRRAHQHRLPLPRAAVGHRGRGIGLQRSARASATSSSRSATSASSACCARDNDDVDDGWLCDKGRWGYQSTRSDGPRHAAAGARRRHAAPGDVGARRSTRRPRGSRKAGSGAVRARRRARPRTRRDGSLQRIFREALGSRQRRLAAGRRARRRRRRAGARIPTSRPRSPDIDRASAVLVLECDPLDEAPIFDLRLRKAVRRFGARLVVASSAPTALDGGATEVLRFAPGGAEALLRGAPEGAARVRDGAGAAHATATPRRTSDGGALPGHAELAEFLAEQSARAPRGAAGVDPHGPARRRPRC